MIELVQGHLESLNRTHWFLDGFPRTVPQARGLSALLQSKKLPLTVVFNLDVPHDVILQRIQDRWIHAPSGRVYNLSYNPPRTPGKDDLTGEPLTKRPDDNVVRLFLLHSHVW